MLKSRTRELAKWEDKDVVKRTSRTPGYISNGIACPECGVELYDRDDVSYLSYPPKRGVYCFGSKHKKKPYFVGNRDY